ncbi:MAG: hypothetical protein LBF95_10090, partial [Treponema sp.]|nr:hypothetical protein [Treponema sp.]
MSTRGFDKLMEEWGLAAKWEARGWKEGRQAAAAEYAERTPAVLPGPPVGHRSVVAVFRPFYEFRNAVLT